MSEVLSGLEVSLNKGDFKKSIEVMRAWLASAEAGDPRLLIHRCNPTLRPKLVLLLRDLLSRYPTTLLGCPVLVYASPEQELDSPQPPFLRLPFPSHEHYQPCSDLRFLGWLPLRTDLPVAQPFRPEQHETTVQWYQPSAVVALFRSHPSVFDLDTLELPPHWWGELFRSVQGNINLSARMLLPYPDALEAAELLEASARGEPHPDRGHFLSDAAWAWAGDEGLLFQESCRHYAKENE